MLLVPIYFLVVKSFVDDESEYFSPVLSFLAFMLTVYCVLAFNPLTVTVVLPLPSKVFINVLVLFLLVVLLTKVTWIFTFVFFRVGSEIGIVREVLVSLAPDLILMFSAANAEEMPTGPAPRDNPEAPIITAIPLTASARRTFCFILLFHY